MKIKILISLAFLLLGLTHCTSDEIPVNQVKHTILVYMIANNNLDSFGKNNIRNMAAIATDQNLNGGNLVVYYAPANSTPKLVRIQATDQDLNSQENFNAYIEEHTLKEYSSQNSVDPVVMQHVIRDMVNYCPAEKYGMVLWSHGTAWLPSNYTHMLRSFGSDDGKQMEINELVQGLPDHFFDFLLFDACYMGSIECAYELKEKADYIIASPTETLADGFPYKRIVPHFFANEFKPEKIAEDFYTYYQNSSSPYATVSVTKTAELDQLATTVRDILQSRSEEDIFALPLDRMQVLERLLYSVHFLYDLDDFIKQLATDEQYNRFTAALNKVVISKYATDQAFFYYGVPQIQTIHRFSGLSVYVPQKSLTQMNEWYKSLAWYKAVYP